MTLLSELRPSDVNYYLEAIMNSDSTGICKLLIGLEAFPAEAPGPLYRAILTLLCH